VSKRDGLAVSVGDKFARAGNPAVRHERRTLDADSRIPTVGSAFLGSAAELCQKPRGLLAPGISLARQERLKALLAQTARVRGAGVALKERERDLTVQVPEQPQRAGPETRKLRAQLVD